MRSLSSEQKELIEALVAEYDPRYPDITPGLLEKDEHLTTALRALFNLPMPGATLVFCGGTSLSKAYRLIDRMSEDADLKIVLSAGTVSQSKNQQQKQLSKLKELVSNELTKEGFSINAGSNDISLKPTFSRTSPCGEYNSERIKSLFSRSTYNLYS